MAHESILIVDDEPDVLDLCLRILEAEGYRVDTVQTGYDALERARQKPFDLLLVDIKMPGLDGMETAQAVKKINPDIICVTMTGYSTMNIAIEALKLGVDEFIIKPFTPSELGTSVASALEKERLYKENIRLRSLVPLFEFNRTLLSTVEEDKLLRHVLQLAQQETRAELALLFLSAGGKLAEYVYPSLLEDESGRPQRLELAGSIMQHQACFSLRRGDPAQPSFEKLLETLGVEFLVGIPLVAKEGQSMGALALGRRSGPFAAGDTEFLQVLAGQAAIAIENAHLFQEIQQAYEELKQLDHLKSEFINIAAHELRTPLAILLGYASVMADEAVGLARDRLDIIIRHAMRLGAIVDDLLSLNYLEKGQAQLDLEEVALREVIEQVIFDLQEMAGGKALHIQVNVPTDFPVLQTDRRKLDLIVTNLLSNAIKYTPEGGHISFQAWLDGDKAIVAVRDSGIGIPPEEHERIFERFYQVEDSLTREHGGIGLGLSITKSLVELCQGRIWVESEIGKGSTFLFELPLQASPQIPPST